RLDVESRMPGGEIVNVPEIVRASTPAWLEEMVTVAVCVPGAMMPVDACNVRVVGATVAASVAVSQPSLDVTVRPSRVLPPLFDTSITCDGGSAPPATALKLNNGAGRPIAGRAVTLMLVVALCPFAVALISTGPPGPTAVTTPSVVTVAMAVLLDCQSITTSVTVTFAASCAVATSCSVAPCSSVALSGAIDTSVIGDVSTE